jgi:hypothetical protein
MAGDRWLLAYRYPDLGAAEEPYTQCRDLVFRLDIEASSYRLQVDGQVHVVVVADTRPPPRIRRMFKGACQDGERQNLPEDLADLLFERRATQKIPGAFWERRTFTE